MIQITQLRKEHLPGLIQVWKEFMDFHAAIHPHFRRGKMGHVAFRKHLLDIMNTPGATIFVALDGKRVVGYTLLEVRQPPPVYNLPISGILSDMAVASEYRRRGIGEKMLAKALEWFRSKGVHWVELSVVTDNIIGNSFWNKQGFRELMKRMYLEI